MAVVDGVELPLKMTHDFTVSDLESVCKFYPEYVKKVMDAGRTAQRFTIYLMEVIRQVETKELNGYTRSRDKCFADFVVHIGLAKFEEYCDKFKEARRDYAIAGEGPAIQ